MNLLLIRAHSQLKFENVVGVTEINLLRAIRCGFESVNDDVERAALERRHECFPIRGHKYRLAPHGRGHRVNHLFFVADVLVWIGGIVEDVRRAAARICAPAQGLLRAGASKTEQADERDVNEATQILQSDYG